jgi:hypothetical protein
MGEMADFMADGVGRGTRDLGWLYDHERSGGRARRRRKHTKRSEYWTLPRKSDEEKELTRLAAKARRFAIRERALFLRLLIEAMKDFEEAEKKQVADWNAKQIGLF